MLWVDKHRPKTVEQLVAHRSIADNLSKLVSGGDCPHLLFYGPSGAGKKTLMRILLRELFGTTVQTSKVETRTWTVTLPSRKLEVELTTSSSKFHVEMNPSDVGNHDRYVVQEFIKEMAKSRPIPVAGAQGFKVLVLDEVDRLSREAQAALRRTMEKYSSACRLMMLCTNLSRVIPPVRSRCMCIRVPAPSTAEVKDVLAAVAGKEGLTLPESLKARIAQETDRNLRRAVLALECCKVANYPFSDDQLVVLPDWELYIREICNNVLMEQTPKQLYLIRGKLYELLINCLPPELIVRQLTLGLMQRVDNNLKCHICKVAAEYERRMQMGSKAIFHLEAFVAKVMVAVFHGRGQKRPHEESAKQADPKRSRTNGSGGDTRHVPAPHDPAPNRHGHSAAHHSTSQPGRTPGGSNPPRQGPR